MTQPAGGNDHPYIATRPRWVQSTVQSRTHRGSDTFRWPSDVHVALYSIEVRAPICPFSGEKVVRLDPRVQLETEVALQSYVIDYRMQPSPKRRCIYVFPIWIRSLLCIYPLQSRRVQFHAFIHHPLATSPTHSTSLDYSNSYWPI